MKVLITDPLSAEGIEILKKENFEVRELPGLKEEELMKEIPSYDALIIRSGTKVTSRVIEKAKRLKVIGRAGTGIDNIDIETATRKGIMVMNTPEGNTISAAEHTIALLLALSRNIPQAYLSLKQGKWERKKFMGTEVYGKVLGIIGLGRIGSEVAKRARGLGMKVLAYDPFISPEKAEEMGVTLLPLKELLPRVDWLTVHTPLTPQTRHLLGRKELSLLKKGVGVINCARGGIIDEKALYEVIKEERIKGAALDVFEEEDPTKISLLELNSVIGTPHLGASTLEAQKRVSVDICSQVADALKGRGIRNAINVPAFPLSLSGKVKNFLSLCEKMGSFLAQNLRGYPKELRILYAGEFSQEETSFLTSSILVGLLKPLFSGQVNYVNAYPLAKERGIKVVEAKSEEGEGYSSLISVGILTNLEERRVEGTIFEETPRIVRIDDYSLDFVPEGNLLVLSNVDRPGAVGKIGTTLGRYGINIGGLTMGRKRRGEKNVSVYLVDAPPPKEALEELLRLEEVIEVRLVRL